MKRFFAVVLSLLLLLPLLVACGDPYKHPEKYVSLPALSEITVTNAQVEETLDDVLSELLENLTGEHFTPVEKSGETVKKGDKVYISYEGYASDPSITLSAEALSALTATESDMISIVPGSGELPEALETILIGCKKGDTVSVTLTYTEDDTDVTELIGKEIVLTVNILSFSRLTVTKDHAVELQYTVSLTDGSVPLDTLLPLLKGAVETTDLADSEDTFNEAFTAAELAPHVIGRNKLESFSFTLTLDAERAANYGYDHAVELTFHATLNEATITPTEFTETMVRELTYGSITTVDAYYDYCRVMVKENLALQAIADAATYTDSYPDDLYEQYYSENYNEALYAYVGNTADYTTEDLAALLTADVLAAVDNAATENTLAELRERFLFEYLYDQLDLKLTDKEYSEALNELYDTYVENYYYMMYYYGINSAEDLEEMLGRDYLEVQFLYEKLLPLLKDEIQFVD